MFQREVFRAKFGPYEGHMSLFLVTVRYATVVVRTKPLGFQVILEARLIHAIPGDFRNVRHGEIEGCSSDRVFYTTVQSSERTMCGQSRREPRCDLTFQQSIVGHVKEQRVICGQRHVEPAFEEIRKRILIQLAKEEVVR